MSAVKITLDKTAVKHKMCGVDMPVALQSETANGQQLAGRLAYGLSEFAASLGVCRDTLDRAAKSGQLRTIRVANRRLIPADEVERVLREGLQVRRGRPRKQRADPAGGNGENTGGGAAGASVA